MREIRVLIAWAILGSAALAFGASLAIDAVPEARFGVSPTGRFYWYLVTFSLFPSVALAVAQWAGLLLMLPRKNLRTALISVLWLPATCAGVLAMLLPIWQWSASFLGDMPIGVAVPILPGAVVLGGAQALILQMLTGTSRYWLISTLLGAAFGSVIGLAIAVNFEGAIEVTWAAITGLGIAAFQGPALLQNAFRS